ncbi:hypothetical protein GUITHDRAFT_88366 [Guillardia theta CCMP2712]|uniref:CWF21 domain-containing protein n=1 Tax=Guillardia theta (strain CCMP2712) TaxID=905079 RepID=L1IZE8_GUITC|nr:hypothetical protein GUITHDRAFT_88366 [Guillardia theta CCMP2712]EKX41648.1 hypothetical protein GUITHDRAFT_88366 [Guillardia theta CCMP2712]|eukprot:XP_005828628.1 hypothetical protein GUITHDRAFT_88366 [Guillardia theta CCMP2712]
MYNGVGLSTVRGSATNGYVQRNLAHVQGKTRVDYQKELEKGMAKPSLASKEPSWEILEHQRKRQTEVKIMEFRIALEDKGVSEDVIEERVAEVRRKLESESMHANLDTGAKKLTDSHALAQAKAREAQRFASAFGIRRDHTEGEAFDRELQEQKKAERQAAREKRKDQEMQEQGEERERKEQEQEQEQERQEHEGKRKGKEEERQEQEQEEGEGGGGTWRAKVWYA